MLLRRLDDDEMPAAANVYSFSPIIARAKDLIRPHRTNEHISLTRLADMARFYRRLLRDLP